MATVSPSRPRTGRNAELGLLVLALGVGIGGYVIVGLNLDGAVPADLPQYAATLGGLALALHLALRWRAPDADPVLLPVVTTLNGLGLAMIFRIDASLESAGRNAGFGDRQLLWTIVGAGLAIAVIVLLKDHRTLRRWPFLAMIAGFVLLLMPMVPGIGQTINGAQLWVRVGPASFQPAELAKILLAIFFAGYFVTRRDALTLAGAKLLGLRLPRFADLAPIVLIWLLSVGVLVLQRDLGTSLLFFGLFVTMLYVSTERPGWPIIGTILFAGGAVAAWRIFGHVQVRVNAWLDPFGHPDTAYQIIQGQYGIAWGGLLGQGWGLGRPTLTPIVKSDFIATAIAEEAGMAGLFAVIMVYAIIVSRGLRTALIGKDPFGKLLIAGLSFTMALQVFTIMGGVTRLLPLTGLTTPFMSQGGSSLVCNWILIAGMMVISHQFRKPAAVAAADVDPDAESTQLIDARAARAGGLR